VANGHAAVCLLCNVHSYVDGTSKWYFLTQEFFISSTVAKIVNYNGVSVTIPVATRSKAWVCGRLLAGIAGSNPAGGMDVYLL
jgi:hypothetical protein